MSIHNRAFVKYTVLFSLLAVFFIYVLLSRLPLGDYISTSSIDESFDFSRYIHSRTLFLRGQRIIIVGDIHGQHDSFQALLSKLFYDPASSSKDVLIHTGDILAKGTIPDCLRVLDWMTTRSIIGVRGNHDQKVIEWKGWQDWIRRHEEGRLWLDDLEHSWEEHNRGLIAEEETEPINANNWVDKQRQKSRKADKKWWDKVPEGWKMFHQHYLIASYVSFSLVVLGFKLILFLAAR
jgi:Calcineurin-like phosphoesterase